MEHRVSPLEQRNPVREEISLYQELLACLDQEVQALKQGQEDRILSLAHLKGQILQRLVELSQTRTPASGVSEDSLEAGVIADLRRQVAVANARNREIIQACLEVIEDFWGQWQAVGAGLYQAGGKMEAGPGGVLFHKRA